MSKVDLLQSIYALKAKLLFSQILDEMTKKLIMIFDSKLECLKSAAELVDMVDI